MTESFCDLKRRCIKSVVKDASVGAQDTCGSVGRAVPDLANGKWKPERSSQAQPDLLLYQKMELRRTNLPTDEYVQFEDHGQFQIECHVVLCQFEILRRLQF